MASNPKAFSIITSDDTPILTGTYDSSDFNGFLTVTVGGTTYSLGSSPELTTNKSTWTLDLSAAPALTEGANSVAVVAQDAAGNPLSTGFTSTVTVDTSSAATSDLLVLGDIAGIESDNYLTVGDIASASLTAKADPFSTIAGNVSLDGGANFFLFATSYSDANGDWSLVLSELGELPPIPGGLELAAQMQFIATDSAGNVSAPIILNAVFDTVVSSAGGGINNIPTINATTTLSNAPIITGQYGYSATPFGATSLSVTVAGATYTLADAALTTSGTNWSLDLSQTAQTLDAGRYDVKVTHSDTAGNIESDTTSGELLIRNSGVSLANPIVNHLETANFKPNITGLFDSSRTTDLSVSINGSTFTLASPELSTSGNNWVLNLSSTPLSNGIYDVNVSQTVVGGITTSDTTANEVIINAAVVAPGVKPQSTADGDVIITGFFHRVQSESFTVSVDGNTYTLGADAELTSTGNKWSLDLASTLAPGSYDVVATSTDALGNSVSDSTTSDIYILDTAGVDEKIVNNFRPIITGEYDDATTDILTVDVAGTTYTLGSEVAALGGGHWSLNLNLAGTSLDKGFHDVTVTATDTDTSTTVTNTVSDAIGVFNLIGTPVSDTLIGNLGSTNGIISNGGYDTIVGGNLNDVIAVTDNNFLSVDGGKGFDTLILAGDGMHLTSIDFTKLFSIEALDLSVGNSSNTITLTTQDVLDMSSNDSLTVTGEATDTVNLDGWGASTGTQVIDSVTYDSYSDNGASLLIEQGISVMYG